MRCLSCPLLYRAWKKYHPRCPCLSWRWKKGPSHQHRVRLLRPAPRHATRRTSPKRQARRCTGAVALCWRRHLAGREVLPDLDLAGANPCRARILPGPDLAGPDTLPRRGLVGKGLDGNPAFGLLSSDHGLNVFLMPWTCLQLSPGRPCRRYGYNYSCTSTGY